MALQLLKHDLLSLLSSVLLHLQVAPLHGLDALVDRLSCTVLFEIFPHSTENIDLSCIRIIDLSIGGVLGWYPVDRRVTVPLHG